jgi:uncharacterized protein (TIGR03083 family)
MQIAAVENRKFAELLRGLAPDDWSRPTDCARWDARALAAHVIGSAAGQAALREFIRQVRKGKPITVELGSEHWWDGMNELQARERAALSNADLITEWDVIAERARRARSRLPRPIARLPLLKLPPPVGRQPIGYLFDMGFTRDVWMHRIDLARATGRTLDIEADHDGRIVADIVAEWATLHGEPFTLDLTGPAGGSYAQGDGGDSRSLDAIDFSRILAERADGAGVLQHKLPL